jgi:hypothetical protein
MIENQSDFNSGGTRVFFSPSRAQSNTTNTSNTDSLYERFYQAMSENQKTIEASGEEIATRLKTIYSQGVNGNRDEVASLMADLRRASHESGLINKMKLKAHRTSESLFVVLKNTRM